MIKPLLRPLLQALFGGAIIPFAMAPYGLWPLSLIGLFLIGLSLRKASAGQSVLRGFVAGLAMYTSGVSWVYVAIAQFGASSEWLAWALTALFIIGVSAVFALPFALYGRFISRTLLGQTLGFAAIWVLGEWLRSWFLTGFPWLYIGYAHLDTYLSGYAPVGGVFSVSFAAAGCTSLLLLLYLRWQDHRLQADNFTDKEPSKYSTITGFRKNRSYEKNSACQISSCKKNWGSVAFSIMLIWGIGFGLSKVNWTQVKPGILDIGIMQPNIPQEHKWDPQYYSQTLETFGELSASLWGLDWIIWPEAAVPYPYHQAAPLLDQVNEISREEGSVFITGIIYDDYDKQKYYNAIIARGLGHGEYFKQRLVPFGEYVPFEAFLRGLIAFFNLPTSIIHVGPFNPMGLNANGVKVAANICYEIAYPDLIAKIAKEKDIILTISNDAWFGLSNGPLQHFDMARMRAIETGRYTVRATNNGISGFIAPNGDVIKTGGRFTRETITGQVQRVWGSTPFMVWRSWPITLLVFFIIFCCSYHQRDSKL